VGFNAERIAIDVYEDAQQTGETITLGTVERRLDELRSHEPNCPCGLCTAADSVRASAVWYVVRGWGAGIAATKRRAAR
jgi:hypothetical protein